MLGARRVERPLALLLAAVGLAAVAATAAAEDGYRLWLRYAELPEETGTLAAEHFRFIERPAQSSPTLDAALDELELGLGSLLGRPIEQVEFEPDGNDLADGSVVLGTPDSLGERGLRIGVEADSADAYHVASRRNGRGAVIVIAGNSEVAQLYGVFALLRYLASGGDPDRIDLESSPRIDHRLLNHWDNLDRSVERGYAGLSLW
ncbi:MAG: alpha-glucuronidase family glycosyl hydrolase, partial [Gammaproteobacteria bacterium]